MQISTVCYIKNQNDLLMLYRNKKEDDVNRGKWIGVGGKLEKGEAPEEGVRREVKEETGLEVFNYRLIGLLTFKYEQKETEYIFVYTAETKERDFIPCDEGETAWIPLEKTEDLALWEGDRLFLPYLKEEREYFSLKLHYSADDELLSAEFF